MMGYSLGPPTAEKPLALRNVGETMNLDRAICELREQLRMLNIAIAALERYEADQGTGKGRPPRWLLDTRYFGEDSEGATSQFGQNIVR